ncbi:MAG: DUF421 domain-containing protein [Eubacteriales bacterium]|nr:DUF421 domain-containing protein [Eubacteriales bacterium]
MIIIIIRTLIIYFSLLLIMRVMGKRQLGEMELTEFVVAVLVADLAANPLQDLGIPMINGIVPIITLFCCEVLLTWIGGKSIRFRAIMFDKPSILIEHGRIDPAEMAKNRFTPEELMKALRAKDCVDVSKIQYAILETDGKISILKEPAEAPVSAKQFGAEIPHKGLPHIVISEGRIISDNLAIAGFDERWLEERIKTTKYSSAKDIYIMTVDEAGNVYISGKDGR